MACYRPLQAYKTSDGSIVFDHRKADSDLKLPCGACVGCRIDRARAWSLRCVHEASVHRLNCFVTLTYSDKNLPPGGSLRYRDFQLFMKRLRKRAQTRVRFFVCGEYGEQLLRPHYHACLFGYDFPDKKPVNYLSSGGGWRSKLLETLWPFGYTHLGELNVQSAGYAARYVLKKVTGSIAEDHYRRVDADGVIYDLAPEFARMSLRPGIAAGWFARYSDDVTQGDYVVHQGRKFPVPKFYDRLLDRVSPRRLQEIKEERELKALAFRPDATPERLLVRETVAAARLKTLTRNYEDDSTRSGGAR